MPRPRPVTLQDIARRAGVSKMTVSLALRGHPHAAAATRDRLRRLAKEMGYRPNPLVVANMTLLRAGRRSAYAGTIAFVGFGESPERSAWSRNVNGCSRARVASQSESLARSAAIGFLSTP